MSKRAIYFLALMVAVIALLATGVPVFAADTDSRIESSAKQSYAFKTYLKDDDIKVESKKGVVTLTGTVANEYHKSLAKDTVESLPGVKSVDNRLELKAESPATNSDEWLADKVKATLLFHRSVSATNTEVSAKDGVVTLRGNADSQAQKELTSEYAADVEGVKSVDNELNVPGTAPTAPEPAFHSAGEQIDDASITGQVKMALLLHRSTSALHTSVKTNHGNVTVSGRAANNAEKDLVTKLVNDVPGVKSVNNRMTTK